ncbi:hypothetical protein CBA19C6_15110 [Cupriavidus pauculus]|nr:hypothetical protein CBA19C6_15110 [Cupriavidus pauculus]
MRDCIHCLISLESQATLLPANGTGFGKSPRRILS